MFGKKNETPKAEFQLFTIYDSKGQTYDLPVFQPNEHVLIREVLNMFKDPQQQKNRMLVNAEDFSIFCCGTFDKETGLVTPIQPLKHIANCHDLRAIVQRENGQNGQGALSLT